MNIEKTDNTATGEYHLPNYLALRSTETVEFSSEQLSDDDYMVKLIPVTLPSLTEDMHTGVSTTTVVCAKKYVTPDSEGEARWGWVFMELHTKNWIGIKLEELGVSYGEWVYMRLVSNVERLSASGEGA